MQHLLVFIAASIVLGVASAYPLVQKRIINGAAAQDGMYPYAVSITRTVDEEWSYTCGGTILNQHYVVTAAHCVVNHTTNAIARPSQITIGYGSNNKTLQNHVIAEEIITHPEYLRSESYHDIAIIKAPLLPPQKGIVENIRVYRGELPEGMPLTVFGWGSIVRGGSQIVTSDVLKQTEVKVGNTQRCESYEIFARSKGSPQICTENNLTPGTSPCSGDSGSGLIATVDGRPYLAGIVSYGSGPDTDEPLCAKKDGYNAYTHVDSYRDFIARATKLGKDTL
ncbi:hypothetical protein GGI12_001341 [Dipsacomyces acuminosporus]|nr:hypothetical protein GGI12_001341 [Dipsacomyces acuminosporus]